MAAALYPEVPQTFTLDKPGNQAPVVVLNTPRANEKLRDIVKVSGSAYDPDGRVVSVQIVIDNAKAFTAIYGTASPEACEMLKDVAACPNIGFEYNLDTRLLSNGVHSLQVFVKDDRGTTTSAPAIINNGMNIIVEN